MKRRWFNRVWVRIVLTLVLMGLLVGWVGPASIWNTVRTSHLHLLLLSLLFTPFVIGVKTLRWLLLARTRVALSFKEALYSYLAGLALATLTPLAVGEAGRGLFVRFGDRADLTGKVILDKLVDLSAVGVFAGAGLALTEDAAARFIGVAILAVVVGAWGLGVFLLPKLQRLLVGRQSGWLGRFRIPAVVDGLIATPRRQLFLNMGLSLIGFTIFYLQAFVLLRAFWPQATWAVVPYFPIITLSTILPIAIGGVGIREWTAILLLRQFGVTESVAFNAFFVHFVVVQLLPAIVGALVIGQFRRDMGSVPAEDAS